jgi:hypothetical protein
MMVKAAVALTGPSSVPKIVSCSSSSPSSALIRMREEATRSGGEAGAEARNHPLQLAKCSLYIRLGERQLGEHTQERGQPRHLGRCPVLQVRKDGVLIFCTTCRRTPYRDLVEIAHDVTDARASCPLEGGTVASPYSLTKSATTVKIASGTAFLLVAGWKKAITTIQSLTM